MVVLKKGLLLCEKEGIFFYLFVCLLGFWECPFFFSFLFFSPYPSERVYFGVLGVK